MLGINCGSGGEFRDSQPPREFLSMSGLALGGMALPTMLRASYREANLRRDRERGDLGKQLKPRVIFMPRNFHFSIRIFPRLYSVRASRKYFTCPSRKRRLRPPKWTDLPRRLAGVVGMVRGK